MTTPSPPSVLRLVLWPTLLTLVVSVLRLLLEVRGSINTASGGGLALLGISWLVLPFGAFFGWRLRREDLAPRVRRAWAWSLLALVGLVAAVAWSFAGIDRAGTGEAAFADLRRAVAVVLPVAVAMAAVAFAVWPRLAWTLLVYAIPARLTVIAITWLAKEQGWNTHYTKLGPAGIERELPETMAAVGLAQLGFWIPYTIVAGSLAGSLAAAAARRRGPAR